MHLAPHRNLRADLERAIGLFFVRNIRSFDATDYSEPVVHCQTYGLISLSYLSRVCYRNDEGQEKG